MRGMHWFLTGMRHLRFEELLGLLDTMAQWNFNTVVFEYDHRFPYRKHSAVSAPDAFSRDQARELVGHAEELGLNVIPFHQSLGHVDFILRHAAYSGIREDAGDHSQWCPLHPQSFELFKEMADDIIDLHGKSKYFHIGGDETRLLGKCPNCQDWVKRNEPNGRGKLYLDFIRKAWPTSCPWG